MGLKTCISHFLESYVFSLGSLKWVAAPSGKGGNEAPHTQGRENVYLWRERSKLRTIMIIVTDSRWPWLKVYVCIYLHICVCIFSHMFGGILSSYHHLPNFTTLLSGWVKRHLQASQRTLKDLAFFSIFSFSVSVAIVGSIFGVFSTIWLGF